MTQQTSTVDTAFKIKDLEDENELLLLQLHQVQEELEVYFLKYKDLEAGRGGSAPAAAGTNIAWIDDELPEALAEVERLKTLAQVQTEIKEIESRNALNVKLGNMLLEGSSSVGGISRIPFALLAFWRNATSKNIPGALGGKEFTGVIKAYEERGFVGVKSILKEDGLSPIVKANAYTAVARHLMRRDAKAAAEAASKAFEIDPKPYRLKWLACRTHEACHALRADAMLDLLPDSITFSESEAKQVSQIRYEAKNQRQRDARQKSQIVSKQQQIQSQLATLAAEKAQLTHSRDEAAKHLTELKAQLEALNKEKAVLSQERSALQQEKAGLATARDEQAKVAGDRLNQINALTAEKGQIAQARDEASKQLNELKTQLEALNKEKAVLSQERSALQQERASLATARDEQAKVAGDRLNQINALTAEKGQIAQARDEASKQLNELKTQLEALNKEKAVLSQERSALQQERASLATARDEQAKVAGDRLNQINALTAEKAQLTQVRDEASKQLNELKTQLEALNKEKAVLSQERSALQQERASLATARDEQSKLAAERQSQLTSLAQQLQTRKNNESELGIRQDLINQELVRAEAQINLIKELLLREQN